MSKNDTTREHFEKQCAGYVLNLLEPKEREDFERILAEEDEAQLETLRKMQAASEGVEFNRDDPASCEAARQEILNRIKDEDEIQLASKQSSDSQERKDIEENDVVEWSTFSITAAIALLFITFSLIFYTFSLNSDLREREKIIQQQQSQISGLQNKIREQEELLSIMESREVKLVSMRGLEVNPGGYGKVLWNPTSRSALLQVSNLPKAPENKQYQLWIIKNNQAFKASLISISEPNKPAQFFNFEIPAVGQPPDSFTLTLEPKGGSSQPIGELYLLGNRDED